jgi:phosphohistidine phosphatase
MKTLLIMRHAKSAYPTDAAEDFDRPLSRRGVEDAPRMGRVLKANGLVPQKIICSAAARAVETARAVADVTGFPVAELEPDGRLYLASTDTLTQVAAETDDLASTLLTVAHNPGMEEWVGRLCGAKVRFPTAALAVIALPLSRWLDISRVSGQLQWLAVPRMIKKIS